MCLESHAPAARPAALKVLILTVLLAWAFWPELAYAAQLMLSSSDWTHGLVAPLALLLLVARRRRYLAQDLTRGSVWGVILLLLSFAVYAANIWPWAYGYFRHVAFVPAAGGVVLATCGWRVLKRCLPMLLILLLSIPIGPRYYAGLIIKPETYTLATARVVLDRLPGVEVQLHGPDLDFATADATVTGDPEIADDIAYGYDDFHRLTSAAYDSDASSEAFDYDLLGNRLAYDDRAAIATTTYAHNCVNEYTDITPGALDPQHDNAGNLTRTEFGLTLAYDYEQRLLEVRYPSGIAQATYTYDALGRRATQVIRRGEATRFVYDGGSDGTAHRVIAEYDTAGPLQRYYVDGPTYVDEHVLLREASGPAAGEFYYLHAALYSITGLTDASGLPVIRYAYDAYGLPATYATTAEPLCQPCDANCDGRVNTFDIDPFVQLLAGGPQCSWCAGDANCDGQVNVFDIDPFVVCLGASGGAECGWPPGSGAGGTPPPADSYLFTGRRLDFDLRDDDGSVTGQPGRPLLVLYDYRAREYDAYHGRFCQRDPAALPDTDVCSIARRALAIDELQRILIERVRQGLTDGPWTTLNPLLIATLDAKQLYLRFAGVPLGGHALGLRTAHLDSLNLYQYGRSNPQFYLDPDGRFSLVELGISSGISGLLGALFGGVSSAISGGSFWQGALEGGIAGALGGTAGYGVTAFAASASGLFAAIAAEPVRFALGSMSSGFVSSGVQSLLDGNGLEQVLADAFFGMTISGVLGGGSYALAWSKGAISASTSSGLVDLDPFITEVADVLASVYGGGFGVWYAALMDSLR